MFNWKTGLLTLWLLLMATAIASLEDILPIPVVDVPCCQCIGESASTQPRHWCPAPTGGCHNSDSANHNCAGVISAQIYCPDAPCIDGSLPLPMRPFTKKGVGYYGGNCSDFGTAGLSNISWFYDWGFVQGSFQRNGCPSVQANHNIDGVEYVPMIWGKNTLMNMSTINTTYIRGARYIFGFNEPDHSGQSDMTPLEGAQLWPNMVTLARAENLTIVAPCVANYNAGQQWLAAWNQACVNLTGAACAFEHMCLHAYFEVDQVAGLFSSLARMHGDYGRPIWLNEFACPPYKNCSAADQLTFAKMVVPKLEALPYLFRYAWFMARDTQGESLLVNNISLNGVERTVLGDWYDSFSADSNNSNL